MPITTILFDGGGIIIDETRIEQSIAEVMTSILSQFDPAFDIDCYWRDTEEAVYRFAPSTYRYVLWKNTQDATKFERLYDLYMDRLSRERPLLTVTEGIEPELRKLHQHFRFAIAGQYGAEILEALRTANILDLFDSTVTQDDFRITKPDPRYFEQIAHACNVSPNQCIMVGDRIDNDVIPARQVGMLSVRFRTGLHRKQEPRTPAEIPDAEITSISQLAQTVLDLARSR